MNNGTKFSLENDLYEYQKSDVDRISNSESNYLLLSEMGTGKTPVAIAVAKFNKYNCVLIICPKSLKLEWYRQIKDWYGVEPALSRGCYAKLIPLEKVLTGKTPIFITNYETFRIERHLEVLNQIPFEFVIMDEAHKIRNHNTKMSKGLKNFVENHPNTRYLALTGSPIVNNPMDLFTILNLLHPYIYPTNSRMDFLRKYCYYQHSRYGIKVTGTHNMDELRHNTSEFTIRHTKKEVLPYLPDKYYRRVILEMEEDQKEAYKNLEDELFVLLDSGEPLYAPSVVAQIMRLRQICLEPRIINVPASSSKTEFLKDLIEDTGEKLVIFSCFATYIRHLHNQLSDIPHVMITGQQSMEERREAVDKFQSDDSIRLVIGTIQSMGEGITLTAASNVVLMDRWWNPAVNNQAVDRLHRIGQKNAVQIIIPINDESIDLSLDKILQSKGELSSAYLGDNTVIREVIEDLRFTK